MKKTLLSTGLLIITIVTVAQSLRFDRFDISNGLSQNNVNCLEVDEFGNIWVGTLDGVNIYDGYQFQKYQPSNSIKGSIIGNHVTALGTGCKGDMWLITRGGGLNHYNATHKTFTLINSSNFGQFNIEQTTHIVQINDSYLCMSQGQTLGIWNRYSNKFQTFKMDGAIFGMKKQNNSTLVVYGRFGIQFVTIHEKTEFKKANLKPCFGLINKDSRYYIVRTDGIVETNGNFSSEKVLVPFTNKYEYGFQPDNINDFACINQDFWLGGNGFLLRFKHENTGYKPQKFENDPNNNFSFKGYFVRRLLVDPMNNLWIGTGKNGLVHLNFLKNQFYHCSWPIEISTDPGSNPVRAICRSRSNELWIGFDRNTLGIILPDGKFEHFENYYTPDGKKNAINSIRLIFEDSDGMIWIGEINNLCYYNRLKKRIETINCLYSWKWPYRCYTIKEFESGILTIASPANIGTIIKKRGTLHTYPLYNESNTINLSVRDIRKDDDGNMWLSKDDGGLLKMQIPGSKHEYIRTESHNLSDNKVYCLLIDDDRIWIGTNNGLNLFDIKQNKVIKSFFETDGLCNNIVYNITEDKSGNLWLSTNKGLSYFNTSKNVFKSFLSDYSFADDAHFVDHNGNIYYGGYNGVISFHPLKIFTDYPVSKPIIQSFWNKDKELLPGDTLNGKVLFGKPVSKIENIDLSYKNNTFSIGFNAYPFDYPNTHRFRYRLSGLHNNWIETKTNRLASYTKLAPGKYTFELQVASSHQEFGETIKLKVTIIPPFWQTLWFRIALVLTFLTFIWAIYHLRVRQIRIRNIWLQKKIEEQTSVLKQQNQTILEISEQLHESDQAKLRFFTDISHEFRTPLTIILGNAEELSNNSKHSIKSIKRNAILLLRLINQIIDLRKLDQNQLTLSISQIEVVSYVKTVVESFKGLAEQKNIDLTMETSQPEIYVWLDAEKLEMILYNLLSNAIKYSTQGKSVTIFLDKTPTTFQIKIKDEGVGISESEQTRIFERYYRSKQHSEMAGGHGIGLSLVKGFVELQKGKIDLNSKEGEGTCFTLTFLLGNDHFPPNEIENPKTSFVIENEWSDSNPMFINEFGHQKILIVEDNPELIDFLVHLLEKHFALKAVNNGKEALEILPDFMPDLVISDIMMPVMDGIAFCKEVKSNIETSHLPVILLSAKTDIETQIDGMETGADAYIEKPFHSRFLLANIQSLLKNRENIKQQFNVSDLKSNLSVSLSKHDHIFIKRINDIIEKELPNPKFNIEILSENVNMSRASFYRKFTSLTGLKPADYIRKIRLKKAYNLLCDQQLTVDQITEKIGFLSVSHFRKSFKDEFGKAPSEILKNKN